MSINNAYNQALQKSTLQEQVSPTIQRVDDRLKQSNTIDFSDLTSDKFTEEEVKNGTFTQNIARNAGELLSGVTTLATAIFAPNSEERKQLGKLVYEFGKSETKLKDLGNLILSTYEITLDDIANQSLGDTLHQAAQGAYQNPVEAGIDLMSLGLGKVISKGLTKLVPRANEFAIKTKLGQDITNANIESMASAQRFVEDVSKIESKYDPTIIGRAFRQIEKVGTNNVPQNLVAPVRDLLAANNNYKQALSKAGVELWDDIELASRTFVANKFNIPFAKVDDAVMNTKFGKAAKEFVIQNDIKPIFHLKPETTKALLDIGEDLPRTTIKERIIGNLDYSTAGERMSAKAMEWAGNLRQMNNNTAYSRLNEMINNINKTLPEGKQLSKFEVSSPNRYSKILQELNQEIKKTYLSSGLYLPANIATNTFNVLSNFNYGALSKAVSGTIRNLGKEIPGMAVKTAETPGLRLLSKINNLVGKPARTVDNILSNFSIRYLEALPANQRKFLQSIAPEIATSTLPGKGVLQTFMPFTSYPVAVLQETIENLAGRPLRSNIASTVMEVGSDINNTIQQEDPNILNKDSTKVVRFDEINQQEITRRTEITPVQMALQFLSLGSNEELINIPVLNLIKKIQEGEGDFNNIKLGSKVYRIENGQIQTAKGSFNLVPVITTLARESFSPTYVYNKILVPLLSDKYYTDKTKFVNTMISDSDYANMSYFQQQKVVVGARDKLAKKFTATSEYRNYTDKITKSLVRSINKQRMMREQMSEY